MTRRSRNAWTRVDGADIFPAEHCNYLPQYLNKVFHNITRVRCTSEVRVPSKMQSHGFCTAASDFTRSMSRPSVRHYMERRLIDSEEVESSGTLFNQTGRQ